MWGQPPFDPNYPTGYAPPPGAGSYPSPPPPYAPPPIGFVPPAGSYYPTAASPQTERPPKEQCFYIKSNVNGLVMEVENADVDPGTRVVMVTKADQGRDCQLWFEDYQTGTIKSRLSLLCLDIKVENQLHQTVKSPKSVPANALCPTYVGGKTYYSAVAHTQWGSIPGRAVPNQCWYSYGGAEYCTPDFSWITATNTKLVRNTGSPPAGAVGAGHQTDDGATYYAAIARSQWGRIPGKAKGNTCWYACNGSEHYTSDFDWIVLEMDFIVVNTYVPGKQSQLWECSGDKLQNRQDGTKVMQVCSSARGSQVLSTTASNDVKQKWTFVYHGKQPIKATVQPTLKGVLPVYRPPTYEDVRAGKGIIKPQKPRRYFFIRSEMHGKVLDITGENRAPGTMVIMYPQKSPPADNQLWYLDDNGIIRSKLNDFCLQPSGHGICMQPYTNQANQKWIPAGRKIVLRDDPDMCLDITGEQKKDGAKLCKYQYKASPNQHWTLLYIN